MLKGVFFEIEALVERGKERKKENKERYGARNPTTEHPA